METFRDFILKTDKTNFEGEIIRDKDFNIIKVGQFEVGQCASFITPVKRETSTIIRFENVGGWAIFNGGRVDTRRLIGWEQNPNYGTK